MNKKIILGVTLIIVGLITFGVVYDIFANNETKANEIALNVEDVINALDKTPISYEPANDEEIKTETQLIRYIHRMTHPVVKANQKWYSSVEPSPENIQKALDEIGENSYDFDKNMEEVITHLNNFLDGDFKEADELHNLMWGLEDGVIGKATDIDEKGIKRVVKYYYK